MANKKSYYEYEIMKNSLLRMGNQSPFSYLTTKFLLVFFYCFKNGEKSPEISLKLEIIEDYNNKATPTELSRKY
ncbi:hypothetical protein BpHYR1_040575 [Brachionus plicatilis]|uniref:Uncharacterized protein n=1 Tax=Brachionus plicatilis TaxID=10195 RepID=A0A3M7RGZ2_BRAPC|nr:hypothetical protein BpHYR1_040575 [Brachionus plicatilis]